MQLFGEVKASSETQGNALHADLIAYLKPAIKRKHNDNFMALADSYLSRFYDDIEVLILLALVEKTDDTLSQQQRCRELLSFYQLLESIDLSRPAYQLREAVVYIELGEGIMARNLLLPLEDDIKLGDRASALLAIIARQSKDTGVDGLLGMNVLQIFSL